MVTYGLLQLRQAVLPLPFLLVNITAAIGSTTNTAILCYNNNKSAQSNLARGLCCDAVAHIRPVGPRGPWRAPNSPPKVPLPWTARQTPLPASSLDPSDLRCQTAFRSDPPFFHNALDRDQRTDRQTDRPTDRPRESLMTIGRCALRLMQPNNNNYHHNHNNHNDHQCCHLDE